MRPFRGLGFIWPWLLTLLHLLLLGRMLLLELLGLLRVALFELLFLRVVGVFLFRLLMFLFLSLLEFLVLLILLGSQLVLLLLVALIGRGIAGIGRRGLVRLEFARMTGRRFRFVGRAGFRFLLRLVASAGGVGRRSLVRAAGLFGSYYAGLEVSGLSGRCNGRPALIVGGAERGI